ncbi:7-carboxy-7-deazaguanine synthase QueE [Candidatus Omnitrophota bacterium]
MKGKIAEIFYSIQGEGLYLGARQLFVRFFGCNLKCKFCDTKLKSFKEYEPEELAKELTGLYRSGCHSISFTGGEPLMQKDFLRSALEIIKQRPVKIYLETNGTLPEALGEVIDLLDIVVMDLKLPSSTGLNDFWEEHRRFLKLASKKDVFLKAVICNSTREDDLERALALISDTDRETMLVLQPNAYEDHNHLQEKLQGFKDIAMKRDIISFIIPQAHKMLGIR